MTSPTLITGATGFIGQHLQHTLVERNIPILCTTRRDPASVINGVQISDIDGETDWTKALDGIETVIHLAGRAHVLQEEADDPLTAFRRVNRDGTIRLAEQMIAHGCKRLVFVSTIGVNGDGTPIDQPFTEATPPAPEMPYAVAKWEAEQGLAPLQDQLEIVIVRPPLVYGPDAPGNFGRLMRWVERGVPLPLGATANRRSFVSVQNLCDFLAVCSEHPAAAGEMFLISDGEDVSTTAFLQEIADALGQPARLIPIPPALMQLPLRTLGRERMYHQLFGSLVVDSNKAQNTLGWQPPLSMPASMAALAR